MNRIEPPIQKLVFFSKMEQDYDEEIAIHYHAFRPELHSLILADCLRNERFDKGLDIGSGTGQSSIALSAFCEQVIGIEPSAAMLNNAIAHPRVTYSGYDLVTIPLKNDEATIITFAGVLYYAKSQELLKEVSRVARSGAKVVIYDFEVLTAAILSSITNEQFLSVGTDYKHDVDLSGLDLTDFKLLQKQKEKTILGLNPEQLSHILLADSIQFHWLKQQFGKQDLHKKVMTALDTIAENNSIPVPADLYSTVYTYTG
ncbi:class I SAM-dependent methyltransferase [Muriicola sp. Z0-33]|uniref:class I SAM-dependent methyltransferase n=1 Tax=Muriicola sp. Z0-33 TaxID=2816957 RepID=UPI0022382CB2|nr:class I SAM-dependent methyltransferase [Muriicola sp. Z0-33]MCW5517371.1 class I SAM-dependent methyltransferase [Muriicola sp. Z0-33]